jgi:uncharacterized RDD family membrane protein YckC
MNIPKILLFNKFSMGLVDQIENLSFYGRRLKSMETDFSWILGCSVPIYTIFLIPIFIIENKIQDSIESMLFTLIMGLIPFSMIIFMILNKDSFKGRSFAKRKYGYQIIDNKTNIMASPFQCVIRNITMIFWPIEAIIALINPSRRIGDLVAGTRVIDHEKENPELLFNEINSNWNCPDKRKVIYTSLIATLLMDILAMLPMLLIITKRF